MFEVVSVLPDAGMKEMQRHYSCAFAGISTSLRQDRSTFANAGSSKSLEIMQLEMVHIKDSQGVPIHQNSAASTDVSRRCLCIWVQACLHCQPGWLDSIYHLSQLCCYMLGLISETSRIHFMNGGHAVDR